MKLSRLSFAVVVATALPTFALAQHSHGGGGQTERPPEREKHPHSSHPATPTGLLPPGSARKIEVLVVYYGFSPSEIHAEQGEEIELRVRRSAEDRCSAGLAISGRPGIVQLPLTETIPVTLKLDRAETIVLDCQDERTKAAIIVAPKCRVPAAEGACSP